MGGSMKTGMLCSTRWSHQVTNEQVWEEYPRPAMVRSSYYNLNGEWDYCFSRTTHKPEHFMGRILVPFSPESPLSGVKRQLLPHEFLWYRRRAPRPSLKKGHRLLLHFGAVDQKCRIFIDGKTAGSHIGGYLPFSLDITDFLPDENTPDFELLLCVQDLSDTSWHSRGKQKLKRGGMFYTAQSGIWQTVWMEEVPASHISSVRITPDFDHACCRILVHLTGDKNAPRILQASIRPETKQDALLRDRPSFLRGQAPDSALFTVSLTASRETTVSLPGFHPWTPEDPFLYHLTLETQEDRVECYFAMRQCDIRTDKQGLPRLYLNHVPYMQTGVLDQGYWPDGLYTAPSDAALQYDILTMKSLGFNMLRKHIKIEPQRWYYHCDRLGMLVWQDMVCGGTSYRHWFVTYLATLFNALHLTIPDGPASYSLLSRREKEGRRQFYREMRDAVRTLFNHPSIVCWVPFNEGWGQFDAQKAADILRSLDPSRLIDHASGWFDQKAGDLASLHYYFFSLKIRPETERALALTEFGGYTWHIPRHSYSRRQYGYGKYKTRASLTAGYRKLLTQTVLPAVRRGISATVYTQLSDVEDEVNGLLTYDREILKPDADTIRHLNQALKEALRP